MDRNSVQAINETSQVKLDKVRTNHEIVYVYRQLFTIKVQFVDEQGKKIGEEKEVVKAYDEGYSYQTKKRNGYRMDYYQISGQAVVRTAQYPVIEIKKIRSNQSLILNYQRTVAIHLQTVVTQRNSQLAQVKQFGTKIRLKDGQGAVADKIFNYYGQEAEDKKMQLLLIDRTSDDFSIDLQSVIPEYYVGLKWEVGQTEANLNQVFESNTVEVANQTEIWIKRTLGQKQQGKRYSWSSKKQAMRIQK